MSQENDEPSDHYKTDQCNFCSTLYKPDMIRFQCICCKDLNLCPECYLAQARYKWHKPTHYFYARSDYDFVIWPDGFTLHDDLTLLEGIEEYGFGNWERIHQFMVRPKNEPYEILIKHFFTVFGENGLLQNASKIEPIQQESFRSYFEKNKKQPEDGAEQNDQLIDEYIQQYFRQNCANTPENINVMKQMCRQPLNIMRYPNRTTLPQYLVYDELPRDTGDGTGQPFLKNFWPRRDELAFEVVNKAEYPIMYLNIVPGCETKDTMNFKLQVLQSYAHRLVLRQEMKKVIFQSGQHRAINDKEKIDEICIKYDKMFEEGYDKAFVLNLLEQDIVPMRHQATIDNIIKYKAERDKAKEEQKEKTEQTTELSTSQANQKAEEQKEKESIIKEQCTFHFRHVDYVNSEQNPELNTLINKYSQFPDLHLVRKYEQENQFLLRAFGSRYKFRQYISSTLQERRLRLEIFYLQMARIMGYRVWYEKLEADINTYFKNPVPDKACYNFLFPPGVIDLNQAQQAYRNYFNVKDYNEIKQLLSKFGIEAEEDVKYVADYLTEVAENSQNSCICEYIMQYDQMVQDFIKQIDVENNSATFAILNHKINEIYNSNIMMNLFNKIISINQMNEKYIQETINCHVIYCYEFIYLILSLYQCLTAGIQFGLSYREAYIQGEKTNLSIQHIPLDTQLCQRVYEKYFGVIDKDNQNSIYFNVYQLLPHLYTNKNENINSIESNYYPSFLLNQNFFEQMQLNSEIQIDCDYAIYCKHFLVNNEIIKSLYDYQLNKNIYIRPHYIFCTLASLIKVFNFEYYKRYLQLLFDVFTSCGLNCRLNQPILHELGSKQSNTRALQIYSDSMQQHLLNAHTKSMELIIQDKNNLTESEQSIIKDHTYDNFINNIYNQYIANNGIITCSSYQYFQKEQAMLIGTNKEVNLRVTNPLYFVSLKALTAFRQLPFISFQEKLMQKKKNQSQTKEKKQSKIGDIGKQTQQFSTFMLNEQQLATALEFLDGFIKLYISYFEEYQIKLNQLLASGKSETSRVQSNNNFLSNLQNMTKTQQVQPQQDFSELELVHQVFNTIQPKTHEINDLVTKLGVNINQPFENQLLKIEENNKDPITAIFGPQLRPTDKQLDNFQLNKVNYNRTRIKPTKQMEKLVCDAQDIEEIRATNVQKAKDDLQLRAILRRYLTLGDLALCCVAQLDLSTYIYAKLHYMYHGTITSNILAALDNRLGVAEVLAFLVESGVGLLEGAPGQQSRDLSGSRTQPIQLEELPWYYGTAYVLLGRKAEPDGQRKPGRASLAESIVQRDACSPQAVQLVRFQVEFSFMRKTIYQQSNFQVLRQQLALLPIQTNIQPPPRLQERLPYVAERQCCEVIVDRMRQALLSADIMRDYHPSGNTILQQRPSLSLVGAGMQHSVLLGSYQQQNTQDNKGFITVRNVAVQTTRSYMQKRQLELKVQQENEKMKRREREREEKKRRETQRIENEQNRNFLNEQLLHQKQKQNKLDQLQFQQQMEQQVAAYQQQQQLLHQQHLQFQQQNQINIQQLNQQLAQQLSQQNTVQTYQNIRPPQLQNTEYVSQKPKRSARVDDSTIIPEPHYNFPKLTLAMCQNDDSVTNCRGNKQPQK